MCGSRRTGSSGAPGRSGTRAGKSLFLKSSEMSGAIIENMSTKKLVVLVLFILVLQVVSIMVGALIGKYADIYFFLFTWLYKDCF